MAPQRNVRIDALSHLSSNVAGRRRRRHQPRRVAHYLRNLPISTRVYHRRVHSFRAIPLFYPSLRSPPIRVYAIEESTCCGSTANTPSPIAINASAIGTGGIQFISQEPCVLRASHRTVTGLEECAGVRAAAARRCRHCEMLGMHAQQKCLVAEKATSPCVAAQRRCIVGQPRPARPPSIDSKKNARGERKNDR